MITLEEKNVLARRRVEYCDNTMLVFRYLKMLEKDPDWRFRSLVGYHLMRKFLDDETFTPTQALEMENMQRPLCGKYWKLPLCAMFPASQVEESSSVDFVFDSYDTYLINLCSFVEEAPVIGFRYVCEDVMSGTQIIKGLVPHDDLRLSERYPGWEFYQVDRSRTDDMTAMFSVEFANVHRVEIAHLSKEDDSLHRIFNSN